MAARSLFPVLMLGAGIVVLSVAGYLLVSDQLANRGSGLEVGFVEPEALTKMKSNSTNRLALRIGNPTSRPARIVGNNAC